MITHTNGVGIETSSELPQTHAIHRKIDYSAIFVYAMTTKATKMLFFVSFFVLGMCVDNMACRWR